MSARTCIDKLRESVDDASIPTHNSCITAKEVAAAEKMLETILLAAAAALLQASSRACATYIDVEAPIVRNGSNSTAAKYFGYSVAPYANANGKWCKENDEYTRTDRDFDRRILVGAPRDDSDGVERFGALYRCKLVTDAECEPFTGYPREKTIKFARRLMRFFIASSFERVRRR